MVGVETLKKFLDAFNRHDPESIMEFFAEKCTMILPRGIHPEWTLTGTTPSGERIEVQGTDHLEFRDGKIVRKNSFWKIVEI